MSKTILNKTPGQSADLGEETLMNVYYGDELERYKAIADITTDRLSEICAAERDGRLVVLPCKVGSDVWVVLPDYTECSAYGEKYSDSSCAGCEVACDSRPTKIIKRRKNVGLISLGGWIESGCFGKTVFLTRAEAEAALRGGLKEGNHAD